MVIIFNSEFSYKSICTYAIYPVCVYLKRPLLFFFIHVYVFVFFFLFKSFEHAIFPVYALFFPYILFRFSGTAAINCCEFSGAFSKIYLPNLFLNFIVYMSTKIVGTYNKRFSCRKRKKKTQNYCHRRSCIGVIRNKRLTYLIILVFVNRSFY